MKKKILVSVGMAALFLCTSWQEAETTVSPNCLFLVDNGESLFITNRVDCELIKMSPDGQKMEKEVSFSSPASATTQDADGELWVVCDRNYGTVCELDGKGLSVQSKIKSGATPSDILYNLLSKSFQVMQRFNNELWGIDPVIRKVKTRVVADREPVSMTVFAGDSCLLTASNLPEIPSTAYPVAVQLDMVDTLSKEVSGCVMLSNSSTDVKSVAVDKNHTFVYVTHLISRYQLPTDQLDRGWVAIDTLSIIDLKARKWLTSVILDIPRKGVADPQAVIVTPGDRQIAIVAAGNQKLVYIDRIASYERLAKAKQGEMVIPSMKTWGDIPNDAGFLYGIRDSIPTQGKGPCSVVTTGGKTYTTNYCTSELVSMDLNGRNVQKQVSSAPLAFIKVGKGDMYFHDATVRLRNRQSCTTCYPNDVHTDGLNWDLLNDGMGNPKDTETLLLLYRTPPCMVTGIRKNAEVAVYSGVKYILFMRGEDETYEPIDEYLKSLRSLPSPYLQNGKLPAEVRSGKKIFEKNCASCYSEQYYIDLRQYKINWTTGPGKGLPMGIPALNECWRAAPYLYDDRSYLIKDMLRVYEPHKPVSEGELGELEEYVLSL